MPVNVVLKKQPDLDSDYMIPCWGVRCYDCGQFQYSSDWSYSGAVKTWNNNNNPNLNKEQ